MRYFAAVLLTFATACFSAHAQQTLLTNPGPANNGFTSTPGAALLLDIQAASGVVITGLTTASAASANTAYQIQMYTRTGSALGGPVGAGPGSSSAGWTLHGTFDATQGPVASAVSLPVTITDLPIASGQTLGVALVFITPACGPRYFGTGTPPLEMYTDANIGVTTGDVRTVPFTTTGVFFSSRALVGSISYRIAVPPPDAVFANGFEDPS